MRPGVVKVWQMWHGTAQRVQSKTTASSAVHKLLRSAVSSSGLLLLICLSTAENEVSSVVRASESDLWLKGHGFKEQRENFLFQGQLSALTLILVSFHIAAHRKIPSFGRKCRWQVTAKHSYIHALYVYGFAWSSVVWFMVVWYTQNALRCQQFHVAPAM